jgi:hypothetical protein
VKVVRHPAGRNVGLAAATAEQVGDAGKVFAREEKESQQATALFGAWTGVPLGHDLFADHLNRPEEEKDEDRHQPALPER